MYKVFLFALLAAMVKAMPQNNKATADEISDKAAASSYGSDNAAVDALAAAAALGSNYISPDKEKQSDKNYGTPAEIKEDDRYNNCSYYKNDGYSCVPYYLCKGGYVITDGGGIIDIRSGFNDVELDPESSKCESYLEVCCRDPAWRGEGKPTKPPKVTTTTTTTAAPFVHRCGRRNIGGIGVRIQNAADGSTQYGEWPHMCAVLRSAEVSGEKVNLYVCGASLIAPGIVLTGAHCVHNFDPKTIKVRCGEWDTQQTIQPVKHQDRYAEHISIHPEFNPTNLQHDFALIHLEDVFYLNQAVDTICLPDQDLDYDSQFLKDNCHATGWGKDKFGKEGNYQVILKQVKMNMVDHDTCQSLLRTTRLGGFFRLDESFNCAGGQPGNDTCKGDGGGPLVCPSRYDLPYDHPNQVYVQSGIVAWGIGCGADIPGVYAKVSAALGFIDWATKCYNGQDTDYFRIAGARRWAKRQYCNFKEKDIPKLERRLQYEEDKDVKREIRNALIRRARALPLYEKAIKACNTGSKDIDCSIDDYSDDYYGNSDNLDLSSHARDNVDAKSANDDEVQNDDDDEEEEKVNTDPRSGDGIDSK